MDGGWLEATHLKTQERVFLPVSDRETLVGRPGDDDPAGKLTVGFDPTLSRSHFTISLHEGGLTVKKQASARRPLFVQGQAAEQFQLPLQGTFTSGQTRFRFTQSRDESIGGASLAHSYTLDLPYLHQVHERNGQRSLQALLALQPLLAGNLDPLKVLEKLLGLMADAVPEARCLMLLQLGEEGNPEILHTTGDPTLQFPSRTLVRQALTEAEPVCHLWDAESQAAGPTQHQGVRWALAAPIEFAHSHYLLYAVGAESFGSSSPGQQDRAVIALLTKVVAVHLQQQHLALAELRYRVEKRRRELSEALQKLNQALAESLETEQVLGRLLECVSQAVGCEQGAVLLEDQGAYTVAARQPGGPCGQRLRSPDDVLQEFAGRMQLPISWRGRQLGWFLAVRQEPYRSEEVELGRALVGQAGPSIQNARLYREVQRLATVDELTGLLNRRAFFQKGRDALAGGQPLAVILLDVDHFKSFNDQYGHQTGDEVLRFVAQTVQQCTDGHGCVVGRYGGEEIVLLVASDGPRWAEHVRRAIEAARVVSSEHGPLQVTASLGCAHGAGNLEDLLKAADAALYAAKAAGRNCVRQAG